MGKICKTWGKNYFSLRVDWTRFVLYQKFISNILYYNFFSIKIPIQRQTEFTASLFLFVFYNFSIIKNGFCIKATKQIIMLIIIFINRVKKWNFFIIIFNYRSWWSNFFQYWRRRLSFLIEWTKILHHVNC